MPNLKKVEELTIRANQEATTLIDAIRLFKAGRFFELDMTTGQKNSIKTRFTASLNVLEVTVQAIKAEMAS